ncbi:hypothetical protein TNCV_247461 [Trichonephila clavipes]|nr:hypothetical protein TNCV_247461 [Trichonephila clavipes]
MSPGPEISLNRNCTSRQREDMRIDMLKVHQPFYTVGPQWLDRNNTDHKFTIMSTQLWINSSVATKIKVHLVE